MFYQVVDLTANNGLGKVVRKNAPLLRNANLGNARMTACRHGSGNRFVYVTDCCNVMQLDLSNGQWVTVAGLDTSFAEFQIYWNTYPGPDGKLYIGNRDGFSNAMSVINNPDNKGSACNFCKRCFRFPPVAGIYSFVSSPPNMPNYGLGARICWPQVVEETTAEMPHIGLYPNPATDLVEIKSMQGSSPIESVTILDLTGRQLQQHAFNAASATLDVSALRAGQYLIQVRDKEGEHTLRLEKL